ncbi:MAG: hypothetical protein EOL87_19010 [Spartobacteria bacterium]|nr:hypothetical protein [Spartobacteria bacterium]
MTNSIGIPAEVLTSANDLAATLDTTLTPHLSSLKSLNRRRLPKMGDNSLAFVEKASEYATTNPQLVPAYLGETPLSEKMQTIASMNAIHKQLAPMLGMLKDTITLYKSEAYKDALAFYKATQIAADRQAPKAELIRNDLAARFKYATRNTESTVKADPENEKGTTE